MRSPDNHAHKRRSVWHRFGRHKFRLLLVLAASLLLNQGLMAMRVDPKSHKVSSSVAVPAAKGQAHENDHALTVKRSSDTEQTNFLLDKASSPNIVDSHDVDAQSESQLSGQSTRLKSKAREVTAMRGSTGARSQQSLKFLEDWRKRGKDKNWHNKQGDATSVHMQETRAARAEQNRLTAAQVSLRDRPEVSSNALMEIPLPSDASGPFPYNRTLFVPVVTDSDLNWEKAHRKYLHTCYNCTDGTKFWNKSDRSNILPKWYQRNPKKHVKQWDTHAQFIMKRMMMQPRRNQLTTWWEEGQKLINVGGRHAPTIETIDFLTGERKLTPFHLSDVNHLEGSVVDAIEAGTGKKLDYKEIWVTCAFYGTMLNQEETLDRVIVVDTRTMAWRWGPHMDVGRGSCMGFKLEYKGYELVCNLGGSVGEHKAAIMIQHTSCYDRVRQIWIQLPREPVSIDHGNVQVVPAGICGTNSPQRIVAFHGRHGAFGVPNRNLFALDVTKEQLEKFPQVLNDLDIEDVLSASTAVDDMVFEGGWYKLMSVSKKHRRPPHAPAAASFDRYVVSWGGAYYKLDKYEGRIGKAPVKTMDSVIIYDMCTAKYCVSRECMTKERFAFIASRVGNEYAAVCGGQADGRNPTFGEWSELVYGVDYKTSVGSDERRSRALNYPACELFNMRTLVNECETWHDGTLESGEA